MRLNQEQGVSIYCREDLAERIDRPLYRAVRELTVKVSQTKSILDLGCSDLVVSLPLLNDGFSVTGIDFDSSALAKASSYTQKARLICADLNELPQVLEVNQDIDTILALDVLEHLQRPEVINLLSNLQEVNQRRPLHLIASVPLISPSLPLAREILRTVKGLRRPTDGLLDRTHQIFMGRRGYQSLLQEAGYFVAEEYFTSWDDGISGQWKTTFDPVTNITKAGPLERFCYEFARNAISFLLAPANDQRRDKIRQSLISIQALYLVQANKPVSVESPLPVMSAAAV